MNQAASLPIFTIILGLFFSPMVQGDFFIPPKIAVDFPYHAFPEGLPQETIIFADDFYMTGAIVHAVMEDVLHAPDSDAALAAFLSLLDMAIQIRLMSSNDPPPGYVGTPILDGVKGEFSYPISSQQQGFFFLFLEEPVHQLTPSSRMGLFLCTPTLFRWHEPYLLSPETVSIQAFLGDYQHERFWYSSIEEFRENYAPDPEPEPMPTVLHTGARPPEEYRLLPSASSESERRLVWNTYPGVLYELQESDDLKNWTTVAGFPTEAAALAMQHEFSLEGEPRFFRIIRRDVQPPVITSAFPAEGDFAIRRFSPITIQLSDDSGIDLTSIALTIGDHGTFTLDAPELYLVGNVLVFDLGGDIALGAYGESVGLALSVSDIHGNSASFDWSFRLELETIYAEGLLIFGSPDALRAGQQIGPIPTRVMAQRWEGSSGPIRMNDSANAWSLTSVEPQRLIITYSDSAPPLFAVDQYLTNLAPATVHEIFYRKITSIEDNPAEGTLVLFTVDVSLAEIVPQGSFRLSEDAIAFEVDENGVILRAVEIRAYSDDFTVELDGIDINWNGLAVFGTFSESGGQTGYELGLPIPAKPKAAERWDSRLILDQGYLKVTPVLDLAFETSLINLLIPWEKGLKNLKADFSLEIKSGLVPRYEFEALSIAGDYQKTLWQTSKIIPIKVGWIEVRPKLDMKVGYSAGLSGYVSAGAFGDLSPFVKIDYELGRDKPILYETGVRDEGFDLVEPIVVLNGELGAYVSLVPHLDVLLYSLAGIFMNVDPKASITGSATTENFSLASAELTVAFDAHLNAGMALRTEEDSTWLPKLTPVPLFEPWTWRWEYPKEEMLRFILQPQNTTLRDGDPLGLTAQAVGPGTLTYEWYKNGHIIQYGGNRYSVPRVNSSHAGTYQVRAWVGDQSMLSETAVVTVRLPDWNDGMVMVQGGTLATSNALDGTAVSTFYIGRHEVTWGEWKEVRTWAAANGYDIGNVGAGCADDHPVHSVNWFDVVKWCNAKSEMDGLNPVYRVSGNVYRSGQPSDTTVMQNLGANGYRLPLEAEWEFAARGGNQTQGYTYAGSNILSDVAWHRDNSVGAACNLWNGRGTWPVGQKAANELGLYDMSGNVWEWCWDVFRHGRSVRGGGWDHFAGYSEYGAAVAERNLDPPSFTFRAYGFRLARSSVP